MITYCDYILAYTYLMNKQDILCVKDYYNKEKS
jgi:hypothetical protein